eukprot:CAMPEP_0119560742 /NCGR_PEP_ID=MMETSP1352-20130426/15713_1 /TAXON_ID=265584 /ORGANISM="Stauroneis constricta, Strain CCMP1120" /LENGTH=2006 /DNA_ID=CAMNT_0007608791 /DNA_START=28 /DNA_END=6048 /DNA_ORIENTATION=+
MSLRTQRTTMMRNSKNKEGGNKSSFWQSQFLVTFSEVEDEGGDTAGRQQKLPSTSRSTSKPASSAATKHGQARGVVDVDIESTKSFEAASDIEEGEEEEFYLLNDNDSENENGGDEDADSHTKNKKRLSSSSFKRGFSIRRKEKRRSKGQPSAAIAANGDSLFESLNDPHGLTTSVFETASFGSDNKSNGNTSTNTDSNSKRSQLRRQMKHLSKSSQRYLTRNGTFALLLRQAMHVIYFYMALILPLIALVIIRRQQLNQMESSFQSLVNQIEDSVNLQRLIVTMEDLSVIVTSQYIQQQQQQAQFSGEDNTAATTSADTNYVTINDFEMIGIAALRSSGAMFFGYHPLVVNETKWTGYAMENYQEWMGPTPNGVPPFPPYIWSVGRNSTTPEPSTNRLPPTESTNGSPYLFSTWQSIPIQSYLVNYNLLDIASSPSMLQNFSSGNDEAILDQLSEFDEDDTLSNLFHTALLQTHSNSSNITYTGQPTSWVYCPIYDRFDDASTRTLIGVWTAVLYWETLLQGVLPESAQNSIMVVLEDSSTVASIEIVNGINTKFHGNEDLHDRGYEYLEHVIQIHDDYIMKLYPTDTLQHHYFTPVPYYVAASILLFFLLVIVSSNHYDIQVQERLKAVLERSKADQKIVAQIFPKQFHKRLLHKKRPQRNKKHVSALEALNISTHGSTAKNAQGGKSKMERRNSATNSVVSFSRQDQGSQEASLTDKKSPNDPLGSPSLHPKEQLKSFLRSSTMDLLDDTTNDELDDLEFQQELLDILSIQPIADYFPHCTVLFADVTGFSAWSSEREPSQVFILLEALFQTMDRIARKRKVFKVETVGDSYMAVTGLPDPQHDHAVRMARFARDCMMHVHQEAKQLESSLGPETGELRLRIGMHSGPVTAGVLRGAKARFQLFGDTVNTAARMESTSLSNRIQISDFTANLLKGANKHAWMKPRTDIVHAKGKGDMHTYWLALRSTALGSNGVRGSLHSRTDSLGTMSVSTGSVSSSNGSTFHNDSDTDINEESLRHTTAGARSESLRNMAKNSRMIDWLSDILMTYLKKIEAQRRDAIASRRQQKQSSASGNHAPQHVPLLAPIGRPDERLPKKDMVLEEVVEAFTQMPTVKAAPTTTDPETIRLSDAVIDQVREFVRAVSMLYHRENPFHNFDHCSHVTQSATKLLKRIVNPSRSVTRRKNAPMSHESLFLQTHGIASDALAQFSVIFCCIIHDVDHRGVPNGQMAKENPALGAKYKNQSVAEQNSVDIAWDLLMQSEFTALQRCIFSNQLELKRFRQYVVNMVMATDIFNPQMKALRNERWERVFPSESEEQSTVTFKVGVDGSDDDDDGGISSMIVARKDYSIRTTKHLVTPNSPDARSNGSDKNDTPRKATIVLEHIIQAADVSHTMQHWNVYKKWNERLFMEMYRAYKAGRSETDPSQGWYKGELWFYDNYIIPLARKLEQCGVFGVSSDECLQFATENRKEWELKGEKIVSDMVRALAEPESTRPSVKVAGYDLSDIETLATAKLVKSMKDLIRKARFLGTFKSEGKRDGQIRAAKCWMEALHIYELCPARKDIPDLSTVFPVYSGLLVFLKAGVILQDDAANFESSMISRYVKEARREGSTIHIARALAAQCESLARRKKYDDAFEVFQSLTVMYDPKEHSAAICKLYGTDRVAQVFSQRALWLDAVGEIDKSISACHRVLADILPHMHPKNVLNTFELLYPIMPLMKKHGAAAQIRHVFSRNVVDNFENHKLMTSLCRPMFLPVLMSLDLSTPDLDERRSRAMDVLEYLRMKMDSRRRSNESGVPITPAGSLQVDPFLDHLYGKLGWSPNSIMAELCLEVAKQLIAARADRIKTDVHSKGSEQLTAATNAVTSDSSESNTSQGERNNHIAQNQQQQQFEFSGPKSDDETMIHSLLRRGVMLSKMVEKAHRSHVTLADSSKPNFSIAFKFHRPIMKELYRLARIELGDSALEDDTFDDYDVELVMDDEERSSQVPITQYATETSLGVLQLRSSL